MTPSSLYSNAPMFTKRRGKGGFQEVWYMKCNALDQVRALWLRFTVLVRQDQSKEIAEVWAIFFERGGNETVRIGVKNTFPIVEFETLEGTGLRIKDSVLLDHRTCGSVKGQSHSIAWDFSLTPGNDSAHNFVPRALSAIGLVKNTALTIHEDWRFTGWCDVDGTRHAWDNAPGMQGHLAGPKNGHSWAWGHCNSLVDETGRHAPVIWDGLSARARLGRHAAPPLTSMYIQLGTERFSINTLADALRAQSNYDFEGWQFSVQKRGYTFKGKLISRLDDFACVTYEDTDGSHLYCHNAKICDLVLDIISPNGAMHRYQSSGSTAYEVVSREAHPEIPAVI